MLQRNDMIYLEERFIPQLMNMTIFTLVRGTQDDRCSGDTVHRFRQSKLTT